MAKVEHNDKPTTIPFSKIKIGEGFLSGHTYYMKIDTITNDIDLKINAIDSYGEGYSFTLDIPVKPLNLKWVFE